ncbi:MAG: pyruvate ferredoxin oxidoreductase [Candidatus Eisenbacteria bacterium]|nr:pyruvate ferredoxin oxidoreductase [Candidatus Eisenbacteria bacterium]
MARRLTLTGNDAGAEAMRQIDPDVVAAFPITPQTELMHKFAEHVADGDVKAEFVLVESEHSAMSATVGAAAAGARAMTATSANGLALMWEIVYIAASYRLPIVMPVINRALSGPINIHCDHSDTMGCRDSGWIQLYSEGAQEVYDNLLQAVRIAEDPDVLLPVMVTFDGFIISHTAEVLDALEDAEARKWVGEYLPKYSLLNTEDPVTFGPLDLQDYYFEHKRQQVEGMRAAPDVIRRVGREYGELTGRPYDLLERYRTDDADLVIIALGSTCGTAKTVVDWMRDEGKKVGLLKIRAFRPFQEKEVAESLKGAQAIGVLDRSISFGAPGGPVHKEIRAALYGADCDTPIVNYIYGLGGRDISTDHIRTVFEELEKLPGSPTPEDNIRFIGLRE